MFLHIKLENRKEPIRVAFIGCGKFVSMFLAQYNHLDKIEIDSIVDINIDQAKKNCLKSGLNEQTVKGINYSSSLDNVIDRDIEIAEKIAKLRDTSGYPEKVSSNMAKNRPPNKMIKIEFTDWNQVE